MSDEESKLRDWLRLALMIVVPAALAAGAAIVQIQTTQAAHDAVHSMILERIGEIERTLRDLKH